MKKTLIFTLTLTIFSATNAISQCTHDDLNQVYWQMRDRLNNFIKNDYDEENDCIGDGIGNWDADKCQFSKAGFGMPASKILSAKAAWGHWKIISDECIDAKLGKDGSEHAHGGPNILDFGGDGTWHLGYYMAMLATEYKLLKKSD